jgi:formylglycine-generating enzyme required for sulfatase activity
MSLANEQSGDVYAQLLGLPPGARPPDHYSLLGIPLFTSNRRTVEEAAHRRMEHLDRIALHPDSATRKAVQRLMTEVAQARVCLANPPAKARYDAELSARLGLDHPTVDIGPGPFWRKKPVLIAGAVLAAILIAGASVMAVYVVKSLWPRPSKTTPVMPPIVKKQPSKPVVKPPPAVPPVKIPPKVALVPPKLPVPVFPPTTASRPAPPAVAGGTATSLPAKSDSLWDGKETVAQYAARAGIKDVETALDLGDNVALKLTLIPAGKFLMGSPEDEKGRGTNEGPRREVTITKPYYLGVFEVTQEQYEKVMGENPSKIKAAQNAVDFVSWDDAVEFCKKLSQRTGKTVSLPTEAQWEHACRAGTTTRFSFGNNDADLGDYAWYDKNSGGKVQPVGGKKPNAFGLYDMHGNVAEWCGDWKGDSYAGAESIDPTGPKSARHRVLRGGVCYGNADFGRSAARGGNWPGYRVPCFGIRVAVDSTSPDAQQAAIPNAADQAAFLKLVAEATGLVSSWPADPAAMSVAQRADVPKALDAVKRALAIRPADTDALALKAKIEKYLNQPTSAPSPATGVAPQPATGPASRPTTQPASEADRAAVAKALEDARRYLATQLDPATGRSKLEYDAGKWRDGVETALVLRALAVAGEKYEESRIMQAGYAWLVRRPRETTELVSLRILAICALPKKPSALASCLRADVNWLLAAASTEGRYGPQSLFGKSTPHMGIEGDWAIMALHAASSEERMTISRTFLERNLRAWVGAQLPSGAWDYVPGKLRRSDSFTMSAAGLCAISIAQEHVGKQIAPGDKKTADESYQRGLKWMREHFNLPQPRRGGYGGFASEHFPGKGLDAMNVGSELRWHWLLNMARLRTATGEREMGGVDLYWFMARQLLDNQNPDGSFGGKGLATGVFQVQLTAFAVLFLESGLPK